MDWNIFDLQICSQIFFFVQFLLLSIFNLPSSSLSWISNFHMKKSLGLKWFNERQSCYKAHILCAFSILSTTIIKPRYNCFDSHHNSKSSQSKRSYFLWSKYFITVSRKSSKKTLTTILNFRVRILNILFTIDRLNCRKVKFDYIQLKKEKLN